MEKRDISILAVETSCDETSCAVIKNGREVISNVVFSQIDIHKLYGGVVPEIASRNHIPKLPEAARAAAGDFSGIDAVAVTCGPGLAGALICGVSFAKALAYGLKKPLVAVNHIEGHISGNYISYPDLEPPFLCLVVSGGHTNIVYVLDYCEYETMGQTRDDAAGEAIDKVSRVLGLPYPGGPNLEKLAKGGNEDAFAMPRSFKGETHLDFSFSGPKTTIINMLHNFSQKGEEFSKKDMAASFQASMARVLADNTFEAARRKGAKKIALAGGVSANTRLREEFLRRGRESGIEIFMPKIEYCTDNAAMIGSAAYYRFIKGERAPMELNAYPMLTLEKTMNKVVK